jgi:hypothetical protein
MMCTHATQKHTHGRYMLSHIHVYVHTRQNPQHACTQAHTPYIRYTVFTQVHTNACVHKNGRYTISHLHAHTCTHMSKSHGMCILTQTHTCTYTVFPTWVTLFLFGSS